MKTLANCNAVDFLTQTNKIRKAVAKWLTDTDILNIRKNVPEMPKFKPLEYPKDVSDDEKEKLFDEYQKEREKVLEGHEKAKREQVKKNLMEMLDKALDEFPMETLEILGMVCFVDKEDLEKTKGIDLLNGAMDAFADDEVVRFFTSLVSLEQKITFLQ